MLSTIRYSPEDPVHDGPCRQSFDDSSHGAVPTCPMDENFGAAAAIDAYDPLAANFVARTRKHRHSGHLASSLQPLDNGKNKVDVEAELGCNVESKSLTVFIEVGENFTLRLLC